MASITRFAFPASWSRSISVKTEGMICQDRPYLSFTVHEERYGLCELEEWATVECEKVPAIKLEGHGHYRAFRPWPGFAESSDGSYLRILENGNVEIHSFFGLVIEP